MEEKQTVKKIMGTKIGGWVVTVKVDDKIVASAYSSPVFKQLTLNP